MKNNNVGSTITAKFNVVFSSLIAIILFVFASAAYAVAPLAGTSIGNQASASYVDQSSVTRNVTSNLSGGTYIATKLI
jgi:trimeric autotransporter adhesin